MNEITWLYSLAGTGPLDHMGVISANQLLPAVWVIGVLPWFQKRPFLYWASTAAMFVLLFVWVRNYGATLQWVHIQVLGLRLLLTLVIVAATGTRAFLLSKRERSTPSGS